jgi:putative ABC transport system permease protein
MIRKAIASVDPNVPVTETMPLIEQVRGVYTDARVAATVIGCTAAIGLLLSAMGLYGVIAFEVSRRAREIGIRMAVGAQPKHVVRVFLRQGLKLILVGSVAGGLLALMTTHLLAAWLFGVRPSDPATFFATLCVLLAVVLLASYVPARRAARIDPMAALRCE